MWDVFPGAWPLAKPQGKEGIVDKYNLIFVACLLIIQCFFLFFGFPLLKIHRDITAWATHRQNRKTAWHSIPPHSISFLMPISTSRQRLSPFLCTRTNRYVCVCLIFSVLLVNVINGILDKLVSRRTGVGIFSLDGGFWFRLFVWKQTCRRRAGKIDGCNGREGREDG